MLESQPLKPPTNSSQPTKLPDKVLWPEFWVDAVNGQSSLALSIVGVALGGVSLIVTSPQSLDVWGRVGVFLLCLVSPFLFLVAWIYGRAIWKRARQYDAVYNAAQSRLVELYLLNENSVNLLNVIITATDVLRCDVVNLTKSGNTVLLVLGGSNSAQLVEGLELLVVDPLNLETLGWFVITQETNEGYFARQTSILNPIWWGWVHQQASEHRRPDFNAIAIAVPRKKAEDK